MPIPATERKATRRVKICGHDWKVVLDPVAGDVTFRQPNKHKCYTVSIKDMLGAAITAHVVRTGERDVSID